MPERNEQQNSPQTQHIKDLTGPSLILSDVLNKLLNPDCTSHLNSQKEDLRRVSTHKSKAPQEENPIVPNDVAPALPTHALT